VTSLDARNDLFKTYSPKFLAVGEKDPTTNDGFMALNYVVQMGQKESSKAASLMAKHHAGRAEMPQFLRVLNNRSDDGTIELLKAIMEKQTDKKVQAKACQALVAACEKAGKAKEAKEYAKVMADKYAGVIPDLSVGKQAPEVVSKDLNGKEVKLSDLRGKVVVLDIWATWCGPCVSMIPHSRELVKKNKDKPFVLVSISADEKKETLTSFLEKQPMPWTHWWNGKSGGILADWEVEAFPTVYVLDTKGIIRAKIVGVNEKELDEAIEKTLKDAEEKK
jgi:thiol-disulfide isomerase/thioredoxin